MTDTHRHEALSRTLDRTQAALSEVISKTIVVQPGTADPLLPDLLAAIRLHLGMDVGFISEFANGYRVFRYVCHSGRHNIIRVGDRDPIEESFCLRVVRGEFPPIIHDAREHEGTRDLAVTHEIGIGAHASVPIQLLNGEVFGTLCCFSTRADYSLNDRDLEFLSVFADLVGTIVDREQAA